MTVPNQQQQEVLTVAHQLIPSLQLCTQCSTALHSGYSPRLNHSFTLFNVCYTTVLQSLEIPQSRKVQYALCISLHKVVNFSWVFGPPLLPAQTYLISSSFLKVAGLTIRACCHKAIFSKTLAGVFFWCLFMYRNGTKNLKNLGLRFHDWKLV